MQVAQKGDAAAEGPDSRSEPQRLRSGAATAGRPGDESQQHPESHAEGLTFDGLGLSDELRRAVRKIGWNTPTLVQQQIIPPALAGRDVLGQSETGTGKTAAFGLPLLQLIPRRSACEALVLVPTRELAVQVGTDLRSLARFSNVRVATITGGQRVRMQAERLEKNPHVIVGTPGRVMDMHRRGLIVYENVRFAVLDEVDRMLDIGFRDDIRQILGAVTQAHQTIFVSATISEEIERLARRYMNDPERIVAHAGPTLTVAEVKQSYFSVEPWDKKRLLVHLLKHEEPAITLVFCRTKQAVDALAEYLGRKQIDAHAIHGDMYQSQRNRVMTRFRRNELRVLVATDLAARGLDIENITHVINYDLPEDPEIYVHRVGRTARAGREGVAWSFVASDEGNLLLAIERLINLEIPRIEYPDFAPGPVPQEVSARREADEQRREDLRVMHSRLPIGAPDPKDAADPTKFPGGLVPAAVPARRLGGRLRIRRR